MRGKENHKERVKEQRRIVTNYTAKCVEDVTLQKCRSMWTKLYQRQCRTF